MACSPTHRRAALLTADLVLELGRCATAQVAATIANAALLTADQGQIHVLFAPSVTGQSISPIFISGDILSFVKRSLTECKPFETANRYQRWTSLSSSAES
jgi:hypothetical protein